MGRGIEEGREAGKPERKTEEEGGEAPKKKRKETGEGRGTKR